MEKQGGVAGVRDLANFFEVSEAVVRDFAYENDVAKVGNALVFQLDDAEALEEELAAEAEDDLDCEEDDEPQDEDDEPEDE
jgi:hypothetical protein